MKKTLCKVLVLALVLCMVLPQTVMAATYNYLEVSIVDNNDPTKEVSQTSAKYNLDNAKIADLFAAAITDKYNDGTFATKFAGSGLDDTMYDGIQAYTAEVGGTDGAWAAYIDATYTDASELKDIVRDVNAPISAMNVDQAYTMTYDNYTVTAIRKTHTTSPGGGYYAPVTPPPAADDDQPGTGGEHVCHAAHLTDVDVAAWYHEAVCDAVENGIMVGVTEDTFDVNGNLTRGMLMTMLARQDGVDTEGGEFWYTKGMEWAVANGVSDGTAPEADITREQLVTMLYRYAQLKGEDVSAAADLAAYTDAENVSDWALDAVKWAVATEVMKGVSETELAPQGTATRAQAAQFFYNFAK